jgi:hypothetical protein
MEKFIRNIYEDFLKLWPTENTLNYMIYEMQVGLSKGFPADTMTLLLDNLYFGYAIDIDAPDINEFVILPTQPQFMEIGYHSRRI